MRLTFSLLAASIVLACAPSPSFPKLSGDALRLRPGSIVAGGFFTCGLDGDGRAVCWGTVGAGAATYRASPTAVDTSLRFSSLTAGRRHVCGLTTDGTASCWGWNEGSVHPKEGGDETDADVLAPIPVDDVLAELGSAQAIAAGGGITCAVTGTPAMRCWASYFGTDTYPAPIELRELVVGDAHACVLDGSGTTLCYGTSHLGQYGTGELNGRAGTPVRAGAALVDLAAHENHTCGLDAGGGIWCWGENKGGHLGPPDPVLATPVRVLENTRLVSLVAGAHHRCGLDASGAAHCVGGNDRGQLGDGTTLRRAALVPVSTDQKFVTLAAGHSHTCGSTAEGEVWCWGANGFGQTGPIGESSTTTPARVNTDDAALTGEAGPPPTPGPAYTRWALSVEPTSVSLRAGTLGEAALTSSDDILRGTPTFTVQAPAGITATLDESTPPHTAVGSGYRRTGVRLAIAPEVAPGTYTLELTGTLGEEDTRTTTLTVIVEASSNDPDFVLSTDRKAHELPVGGTGEARVRVTSIGGFAGPVSLAAARKPGYEARFEPAQVTLAPNGWADVSVTLRVASDAVYMQTSLDVRGVSGRRVRSLPQAFHVARRETATPAFSIDCGTSIPGQVLVPAGGSANFSVHPAAKNLATPLAQLSVALESETPGLTSTFVISENQVTRIGTLQATGVPPGRYTARVVATLGTARAECPLAVGVFGASGGWEPLGGDLLPAVIGGATRAVFGFDHQARPLVLTNAHLSTFDGTKWTTHRRDDYRFSTAAIDATGHQAILARIDGNAFSTQIRTITAGEPKGWPALVVDSTGAVIVAVTGKDLNDENQYATFVLRGVTDPFPSTSTMSPAARVRETAAALSPALAVHGTRLVLAAEEASGLVVRSRQVDLPTGNWSMLPIPAVTLIDDTLRGDGRQFALGLDSQNSVWLAWIGADEHVHLSRLANDTWAQVADVALEPGFSAYHLEMKLDASGRPVLAWHESTTPAFAPVNEAWVGRGVSRIAVQRWSGVALESLGTLSAAGESVEFPSLALDASGRPHVGFAVDGRVAVLRHAD